MQKACSVPARHGDLWARLGSNQRPPACKAGALPLSYAPPRKGTGSIPQRVERPTGSGMPAAAQGLLDRPGQALVTRPRDRPHRWAGTAGGAGHGHARAAARTRSPGSLTAPQARQETSPSALTSFRDPQRAQASRLASQPGTLEHSGHTKICSPPSTPRATGWDPGPDRSAAARIASRACGHPVSVATALAYSSWSRASPSPCSTCQRITPSVSIRNEARRARPTSESNTPYRWATPPCGQKSLSSGKAEAHLLGPGALSVGGVHRQCHDLNALGLEEGEVVAQSLQLSFADTGERRGVEDEKHAPLPAEGGQGHFLVELIRRVKSGASLPTEIGTGVCLVVTPPACPGTRPGTG